MFGTPGQDVLAWEGKQSYPDDCAIKCQQFVLKQFTGQHVDENVLVHEALEHHWYATGGTNPPDVGNLLELHDVAVNRYEHGDQFHLAVELAQGHKPMVGMEHREVVGENPILAAIEDPSAFGVRTMLWSCPESTPGTHNTSRCSSAIRTARPSPPILWSNSSTPGTAAIFSWSPRGRSAAHLPEMVHFDYGLGHLPEVANLPYDQFLEFADRPNALGRWSITTSKCTTTSMFTMTLKTAVSWTITLTTLPTGTAG